MRVLLICLMAIVEIGLCCWPAAGQNALTNGSFEEGAQAPTGWTAGPGGLWATGPAHSGRRCLGGKSEQAAVVWRSEPAPISTVAPGQLEQPQSYRLDGWVRWRQGETVLGLDALDAGGAVVSSAATEPVSGGIGWQFVAVEVDVPANAAAARVWLTVRGEGYLDDVVLAPMLRNLLFNPSFDADSKGRIGFWGEDPLLTLPGVREGSEGADPAGGRSGSALMVEAEKGWWAVRCITIPVPEGLTAFRFSGWARAEQGEPEIRVEWIDPWANIVRLDEARAVQSDGGWTRYEAEDLAAPERASLVTVSVWVREGRASFDDFVLCAVGAAGNKRRLAQVHVNQVGYELAGLKSLVVATNFFPERRAGAAVDIVSAQGERVVSLPLRCAGRIHDGRPDDWGGYYWRADFSRLQQPGAYRAIARIGGIEGESPPFEVADKVLLRETGNLGVDFFFVQRCGFEVPGWHKACHLDDAKLPDGNHLDATGGWHSAGDYNKIMYEYGDGGVVYALLAAYGLAPKHWAQFDRNRDGVPDILDEAEWGARLVAKMQIPDSGGLYNTISQGLGRTWMKWSPPELQTDNIVGTEDDPVIQEGEGNSPLVIGGWARLSALLKERGVKNDYLERAVRLWNHATGGGTQVGSPLLLMSAMELHRVTGEWAYVDYARRSAESLLASQTTKGRLRGAFGSYGEVTAGALALFALNYPYEPLSDEVGWALPKWVAFAASTADNPFGLSKQQVGEHDFFFEPTSALGHNWELLQRAWAGLLIYRLMGDERALRFATDQVDWIMGKNPYGLCMFEGRGAFNPPRYHHRYDSIPGHERGAVPGCVPNGFVRSAAGLDQPGFDLSRTRKERDHPSYRTSEPWLVHNLWYLLALSAGA
jgi:hypothetical protein